MKRYTEDERRALLAELGTSGKSLREFCTERGLSLRTVQRWQREAREQHKGSRPTAERNAPSKRTGFLPVEVARAHSPFRSLREPDIEESRTVPRLVIQVGNGWMLEWEGPVEQGTLEAALRAVVGICGLR